MLEARLGRRWRPLVLTVVSSLMLAACGATAAPGSTAPTPPPSSSPTGSPQPVSPSQEPSGEPSVEPSAAPTPSGDWGALTQYARYGSTAAVLADGLRVRFWPALDSDVIVTLPSGTEILVMSGAVSGDGYHWYEIGFHGFESEATPNGIGTGWVAGLPEAAGPHPEPDDWFIEIGAPVCPPNVDAGVLARLTEWAMDSCGIVIPTLVGQIESCYEGPISPFSYEPTWAWFSCVSLTDGGPHLAIHFPPDYAGPEVERGDLVEVIGHFGFDTAEYGACTVTTTEPELEPQLEAEAQSWAIRCQNRFVVDELTVTGHEELPPLS